MKHLLLMLIALLAPTAVKAQTPDTYDLVIYGGTSAAIAAAVQAKLDGLSVIIVCPDKHLGGLSASGLGWTDSGDKSVIGGLSLAFYKRLGQHYHGKDEAQWTFEPHVAERVFEDMVREHDIPVHRDEWLNRDPGAGVEMDGKRVRSITMLSGKTYTGMMFIDATYEGDLLAAAGVSYTVGREANSQYGETLNGVQLDNAIKHQFENDISAYVVPGDPTSGLLPRISAEPPGVQGEADHKVQAYNYRMCLTREPGNRIPFPKPDGYDPSQYELLLRDLLAGSRHIFVAFSPMPNGKTDTNNRGSFSTDNIGMNYDYPEGSYERRREICDEHRTYQQGYCYFLANDPRVPEDVREWYGAWGLCKDEFVDNGHWPHQIYVREARRMVGDTVITQNHLTRDIPTPRPIGMGSYNMDSHNVQRYVDENGFARNEGDVQVNPGGPYPIDYGAIIPKKAECENLVVVCAVSSSHIAYGSIRMEPVFMILGQSAASAADLAIGSGLAVQDIDYETLKNRLIEEGQVLAKPE
ncbi:MAG: FAD-dependent oxidoreductase [Phycisphaerales bacterium]